MTPLGVILLTRFVQYYHKKFNGKFPMWIMENGMPCVIFDLEI